MDEDCERVMTSWLMISVENWTKKCDFRLLVDDNWNETLGGCSPFPEKNGWHQFEKRKCFRSR